MAGVLSLEQIMLIIILGTLAAIVYSLRVLVLLERRLTKMDENLERIVLKVAKEELKIEHMLNTKKPRKVATKKVTKKTTTKAKKVTKKKK